MVLRLCNTYEKLFFTPFLKKIFLKNKGVNRLYRYYNLKEMFKPEDGIMYLRKSRADDPLLSVSELLEKHELDIDEWCERNLEGKIPQKNRYYEVVSGEKISERYEFQKVLKEIEIPEIKQNAEAIEIKVNEHTGEILSILADGKEVLKTPLHLNFTRYTDNDRNLVHHWNNELRLPLAKTHITSYEKQDNTYKFKGCLAANCRRPFAKFELVYSVIGNKLKVDISYEIEKFAKSLPRFGLEFGIAKEFNSFSSINSFTNSSNLSIAIFKFSMEYA